MSRDLIAKGVTECGYSFGADHWSEYENYSVYQNALYATKANGHEGSTPSSSSTPGRCRRICR
ncbi:MAG: hypothetical protein R3D25_19415 [Geminicoccaceae bacterium]